MDAKRVIAWARTEGRDYGVDPDRIVLAGSSAGAHLTVLAALTANQPALQPGLETHDTSVCAGVALYGYYGPLGDGDDPPSSPFAYGADSAPPMFIIHGDQDTYTSIEGARHLAAHLRATTRAPVVLAELHGAQHSFDVFHSIRFEAVIEAIHAFASFATMKAREQSR